MCKKRTYYWVVIDKFGFEVSDYTGAACKFTTKEEAENYIIEHNLRECHVVEYIHENF